MRGREGLGWQCAMEQRGRGQPSHCTRRWKKALAAVALTLPLWGAPSLASPLPVYSLQELLRSIGHGEPHLVINADLHLDAPAVAGDPHALDFRNTTRLQGDCSAASSSRAAPCRIHAQSDVHLQYTNLHLSGLVFRWPSSPSRDAQPTLLFNGWFATLLEVQLQAPGADPVVRLESGALRWQDALVSACPGSQTRLGALKALDAEQISPAALAPQGVPAAGLPLCPSSRVQQLRPLDRDTHGVHSLHAAVLRWAQAGVVTGPGRVGARRRLQGAEDASAGTGPQVTAAAALTNLTLIAVTVPLTAVTVGLCTFCIFFCLRRYTLQQAWTLRENPPPNVEVLPMGHDDAHHPDFYVPHPLPLPARRTTTKPWYSIRLGGRSAPLLGTVAHSPEPRPPVPPPKRVYAQADERSEAGSCDSKASDLKPGPMELTKLSQKETSYASANGGTHGLGELPLPYHPTGSQDPLTGSSTLAMQAAGTKSSATAAMPGSQRGSAKVAASPQGTTALLDRGAAPGSGGGSVTGCSGTGAGATRAVGDSGTVGTGSGWTGIPLYNDQKRDRVSDTVEGVKGACANLDEALDFMSEERIPLAGRYILTGETNRRAGGQGVVQFARDVDTGEDYAIKFFQRRQAFLREKRFYESDLLREMMPAITDLVDGGVGTPPELGTFSLPPFIVVERGESLDEWVRRIEPGFPTILNVLCDIVSRLKQLHESGIVHRDLKPGNVLWRPRHHSWTLIDFGCAAEIGTLPSLSFSLMYAPPEVVAAVEMRAKTLRADPAVDMWAIGVIAFELLTRSRVFPARATKEEVRNQLMGRTPLPWEDARTKRPKLKQLRILRRTILACLSRDPSSRPTADKLLRSWNRLFDAVTTSSTLFVTQTEPITGTSTRGASTRGPTTGSRPVSVYVPPARSATNAT